MAILNIQIHIPLDYIFDSYKHEKKYMVNIDQKKRYKDIFFKESTFLIPKLPLRLLKYQGISC